MAPLEGFTPRTNLIETDSEFEVTLDVPGISLENFRVELRDGHRSR